jgi:hypothetical protein
VAGVLAPILGWDGAGVEHALADYRAEIARLFTIDP